MGMVTACGARVAGAGDEVDSKVPDAQSEQNRHHCDQGIATKHTWLRCNICHVQGGMVL